MSDEQLVWQMFPGTKFVSEGPKNQAREHNGQMMNANINAAHSNTPSVPSCINIAGIIFANIHFPH